MGRIKVKDPASGKDVTSNLKCLNALQLTIKGTLQVWNSLQSSLQFLCTRRLNQDPLENFFDCVRQQGGNCDTPTTIQFTQAFRKLFYDNYPSPSNTNCDADFDGMLVQCKDTTGKIEPNAVNEITEVTTELFQVDELDYQQPSVEQNLMSSNAITYVTRYLSKKCMQKHNCQVCSKALTNQSELDSSNTLFCFSKAYDNQKALCALTAPTNNLVQYVTNIEEQFVKEFPNMMTKTGIGKSLVDALPKLEVSECKEFPSEYLCRLHIYKTANTLCLEIWK